jgi:hypothetical protein
MRTLLALVFGFIATACWAGSSYLCGSNEQVVFGCTAGDKMISVCASQTFNSTTGYVQYRYGTKSKIELEYPTIKVPPHGYFWFSQTMYSGGGAARIRFVNRGYQYAVFDSTVRTGFGDGPNKPDFSAGVEIKTPKKGKRTRQCTGADGGIAESAYENFDQEEFDDRYDP